jgi:hypothetical protein
MKTLLFCPVLIKKMYSLRMCTGKDISRFYDKYKCNNILKSLIILNRCLSRMRFFYSFMYKYYEHGSFIIYK